MTELNEQQKITLFQNIINRSQIFNCKQSQNFLTKIPSYPLDVLTAASYLKITNMTQATYLNNLKKFDENFDQVQKNILEKIGEYHQTRYHIIKLSLDNVLQTSVLD